MMEEKDKKVLKMLRAMCLDMSFKDLAMSIISKIDNRHSGSHLTTEQNDRLLSGFFDIMDTDGFMKELVPAYEKVFSDEEIDQLIGLFESPVYKLFIEKYPLVTNEAVGIMNEWMSDRKDKLEGYIETFIDEEVDKNEV